MPNMQYHPEIPYNITNIGMRTLNSHKRFSYKTPNYQYFTNVQADMAHLGYQNIPTRSINIDFLYAGEITFDKMEVLAFDMQQYDAAMRERTEHVLENVTVTDETVSGDITMEKEGVLFLSIPYVDGWTAAVNGEKAEIIKANTGFSAIALPGGYSEINLTYRSPYYDLSVFISLAGTTAFIILAVLYFRSKKKAVQNI
jgi:uncharacterized membrane protein YfhO